MLGFGGQKALQLLSNLILTRLLFPEAFGLMALVHVCMTGVAMFSDMGLRPAIIQAKSTGDPDFLNTAWTLQICRGLALWILLCALAYPASYLYGEPALFPLICFCGVSAIVGGFRSINVVLAERALQLNKVVLIKFIAQAVSITIMVILAYLHKSVWSLAIGTIFAPLIEVLLGHAILNGHTHRFCLNRTFAAQFFKFGKWIFWSTTFTFFSGQGIRLIEGGFVSTETLAMIVIAGTIAGVIGELIERFMTGVLFPTLARVNREEPHKFASILTKLRSRIMLITTPSFGLLSLLGVDIIDILYDDRYAFSGYVLTILAINAALRTMPQIYQNALLAQGNSRAHFTTVVILASLNIIGLCVGYKVGGVIGMLIGPGVGYLCGYAVILILIHKLGWVSLKWEALFLSIICVVAVAAFHLHIADYMKDLSFREMPIS